MCTKLQLFCSLLLVSLVTVQAYPSRYSVKGDYMELKVKPKPFQVAIDNPEDVREMVVKDIANQKRVLIVAKNPQPFELGSSASRQVGGYFAPSSQMDRYQYNTGNSAAIQAYYQKQTAPTSSSGYWQGSVMPASLD